MRSFIEFDYNAISIVAFKIHFCCIEFVQQFEKRKTIDLTRVNNVIVINNIFITNTTNKNLRETKNNEKKIMIYYIVNTRIALLTFEN